MFSSQVEEHCGLVLQRSKTEVFSWDGLLPQNLPPGLVRAGDMVLGRWEPGMICYGIPVGTDSYVQHKMEEKVSELAMEIKSVSQVLQDERQALWTVLRSSISQKLDYWLTLVYPSLARKAVESVDKMEWDVLESLLGSHIPLHGEGLGWDCPLWLPIQGLDGRSFQQWVVRQPIKMGGCGLRSKVETSPAAFIGGIEQALPHLTGEGGVCPQLEHVLGDWAGHESTRWQQLLQSGCRTGQEFAASWRILQQEALGCSTFLGQELDGHLAVPVEGVGQGAVDGSTRTKIVQQREELRGAVLNEALERLADSQLRPVCAWLNRDKLSSAWLLCLPGPSGMNSQVFAEAMALLLCMQALSARTGWGPQLAGKLWTSLGIMLYLKYYQVTIGE